MFLFMVAETNREDGSGDSSGDGNSSDGSSSDGSSSDGGSGYVDMGSSSSSNSDDYSSGSENLDNEAPDSLRPYEMEKEAPAGYTYDSESGTISNNITISLPPALFKNLTETSVGLLYTYYSNSSLFPVRRINDSEYPAIATPVIGASLVQIPSVVNLSEPIIMTLPLLVVSKSV